MKRFLWLSISFAVLMSCNPEPNEPTDPIDPISPTFTYCGDGFEFDNYVYATVLISGQCWFAENLRNEHYANGDAIPGELNYVEWNSMNGAMTVFGELGEGGWGEVNGSDDVMSNLADYGRLYNGYAVLDARGLCPIGWHVPTDSEYTELTLNLGGSVVFDEIAGISMKSSASDNPPWDGTNTSGFSALAGGLRDNTGDFTDEGNLGWFWSSTPSPSQSNMAWARRLGSGDAGVRRYSCNKALGCSVRCVRD